MAGSSHDLFVLHADADDDRAWVEDYLKPALGMPPERIITMQCFQPDAPVVDQLERAVMGSRYTLLVLSRAFLEDRWVEFGDQLAAFASVAGRRDRVVPVVYQDCEVPLRIGFRVKLDCTDPASAERAMGLLREMLGRPEPEPERVECPYPGMRPFGEPDARFFHGCEDEIRFMLDHFYGHRFLFVIGSSGSGKSSLVRAGLVPKLPTSTHYTSGFWLVKPMRPGAQPMQALEEVLGGNPEPPGPALQDYWRTMHRHNDCCWWLISSRSFCAGGEGRAIAIHRDDQGPSRVGGLCGPGRDA